MLRRDFIKGLLAIGVTAAVADKLAFIQGLGRVFPINEDKVGWMQLKIDKEFGLGFMITRKMVADDFYSKALKMSNGTIINILTEKNSERLFIRSAKL